MQLVKKLALTLVAAVLVALICVFAIVPLIDARRTAIAARTNVPDVLIDEQSVYAIAIPDPLHLRLPDGRTFRVAYLIGPDPSSPTYQAAIDQVALAIRRWNLKRGLRIVGSNSDGETLVELWGLQRSLGGCGSASWSERREQRIPRWKPLTLELVGNGTHYFEKNVSDEELLKMQAYAKREALGLWKDRAIVSKYFDLDAVKQFAVHATPPVWDVESREQAADLLLRADPQKYAPVLLDIVTGSWERNLDARVRIAQVLDKRGHPEGTAFLMNALRAGQFLGGDGFIGSGVNNPIVRGYSMFWNRGFMDVPGLLRYYDATVAPTTQPSK